MPQSRSTVTRAETLREMCWLLGVEKTRTVSYYPQSDGMVERFNRTMQQMLKTLVSEARDDWDDHLPYLTMAYRSTCHETTGCTPSLLMLGREISLPLDLMFGDPPRQASRYSCPVEYVQWLRKTLQKAYERAQKHTRVAALRQKQNYDANCRPIEYAPGDMVWRWVPPGGSRKLVLGWRGPYRIMSKISEVNYEVRLNPEGRPFRVNVNQLKPHLGRVPSTWAGYSDPLTLPLDRPEESQEQPEEDAPEVHVPEVDELSLRPDSPVAEEVRKGSRRRRVPNRLDL